MKVLAITIFTKVKKQANREAILVRKMSVLASLLLVTLFSVLTRASTIEMLTETLIV
jgi:hypothetical protein